jgi:peroxiredoxin
MTEYTDPAPEGAPAPQPDQDEAGLVHRPPRRGSRPVVGPFTVRHLFIFNAVIAAAVVVLFAFSQPLGVSSSGGLVNPQSTFYLVGAASQGLDIGQAAPDFIGTDDNGQSVRLTDLNGRPISIVDLKGHPLWINFWATWCPPCQHETPDLEAAFQAHQNEGLILLAISIQEVPSTVSDYVSRYGLTYTIGMDVSGAILHTYHVFGIPTHYFVDRNGIIRDRVFGPLDRAGIERRLAEILGP